MHLKVTKLIFSWRCYPNSSLPLNMSELLVSFGCSCQSQGGINQAHLSMNLGTASSRGPRLSSGRHLPEWTSVPRKGQQRNSQIKAIVLGLHLSESTHPYRSTAFLKGAASHFHFHFQYNIAFPSWSQHPPWYDPMTLGIRFLPCLTCPESSP